MELNNEQSQSSATSGEDRIETPQAQENRGGQAPSERANTPSQDTQSPKTLFRETDSGRKEKLENKTDDVVSQFLSKKKSKGVDYIEIIEEMMGEHSKYGYAESTLLGIYDFIEENNYITDKQVEAIENIREHPSGQY